MRFLSIFMLAAFLIITSPRLFSANKFQAGSNKQEIEQIAVQAGNGLTGHYYQSYLKDSTGVIHFSGLTEAFTRIDTVIDFWNGSSNFRFEPVAGWGEDYSVEWTGYIFIEQSGYYGFGTISDDGSQIFIDSNLIVDNGELQWYDWEDNISEGNTSGTIFPELMLDSGFHSISVRFIEDRTYDGIELWWFKSDTISSDIPYYGTTFSGTPPTYNPQTNWELVPKRVLYTERDTTVTGDFVRAPISPPSTLQLRQNFPNPFNAQTTVEFYLSEPASLTLTLYNTGGEQVGVLFSKRFSQGLHRYIWEAGELASGIYFYRLGNGIVYAVKKTLLIK
jgi:hypothetical protein